MLALANLAAWVVQTTILVAVALAAIRLLRLDAPAVRYHFLRALLVICLALPFVQPRVDEVAPSRQATAAASAPSTPRVWSSAPREIGSRMPLSLPDAAMMLVATGMVLRFSWIAAGFWRLRRLRRVGEAAVSLEACDDLARTVTRAASIRFVPHLGQPLTFGFRAPVILLPASLRSQPVPIQRAVLAHELWHVRRRDWFWTVCEEVVRAALWFHPGIWILLSRIQSAREEVVDELSILTTGSRRSYADALLTFADNARWFAVTAFARRRHLVQRLVLISKEAVMSARRVVATAAAVIVVVAAAGWYSVQAFPMRESQTAADRMKALPGPLEQQARQPSPENPVPRRSYQVPPDDPFANEPGSFGVVTLKVVLDAAGQVAEYRPTTVLLRRNNGTVVRVRNQSTAPDRIAWVATANAEAMRNEAFGQLLASLVSSAPAIGLAVAVRPAVRGDPGVRRRSARSAHHRHRRRLRRHPHPLARWRPAASTATGDELTARPHGPTAATTAAAADQLASRDSAAASAPTTARAREWKRRPRRVVRRRGTSSWRDHQAAGEGAERCSGLSAGGKSQGVQGVVILEARIEARWHR